MKSGRYKGKKRYIFLFIFGMIVFIYPTFSNIYYKYITMRVNHILIPSSGTTTESSQKSAEIGTVSSSNIKDKEFQQIQSDPELKPLLGMDRDYISAYNNKLVNISKDTADPFNQNEEDADLSAVTAEVDKNSIFAYIEIPKIGQKLPVYLGATNEHLHSGVAVIQGTSIPIGGENTNSVIAGHTGAIQKLFSDLPELEAGDEIIITNRWEALHYKVTGNKIILPNEEKYLNVVPGKDMITLLTCYHVTPENDRLLVFAQRYYPNEQSKGITKDKIEQKPDIGEYSYISKMNLKVKRWYEKPQTYLISAAGILVFLFLYIVMRRKKE